MRHKWHEGRYMAQPCVRGQKGVRDLHDTADWYDLWQIFIVHVEGLGGTLFFASWVNRHLDCRALLQTDVPVSGEESGRVKVAQGQNKSGRKQTARPLTCQRQRKSTRWTQERRRTRDVQHINMLRPEVSGRHH